MGKKDAASASRKARHQAQLEEEKLRRQKMKAAMYSGEGLPKDVLLEFTPFAKYDRNGLDLTLECCGIESPSWDAATEAFVFQLTKDNMKDLYDAAPGWAWKDAKKRAELFDTDSRFLIVRQRSDRAPVACVVFKFLLDGDWDVLYVFEMQLSRPVQRKGLGKHLLQLAELIARRNGMQWVFLTVLHNNTAAVDFYARLKYTPDVTSPSQQEPAEEACYEIMSKCVDKAAVAAATGTTAPA